MMGMHVARHLGEVLASGVREVVAPGAASSNTPFGSGTHKRVPATGGLRLVVAVENGLAVRCTQFAAAALTAGRPDDVDRRVGHISLQSGE
jgi:CDGSH-type Zn-finger protein